MLTADPYRDEEGTVWWWCRMSAKKTVRQFCERVQLDGIDCRRPPAVLADVEPDVWLCQVCDRELAGAP